jgi:GDPmannose 4,6-dehydratase
VRLGNLNAKRDWGHARDYVEAMWLMLQHPEPLDLVIATGKQYSVRDFVEEASRNLGFDIAWQGNGINEVGVDSKSGQTLIVVDERYFRPAEVETLLGDATKANTLLNWNPRTTFNELVSEMCESDLAWAKSLK